MCTTHKLSLFTKCTKGQVLMHSLHVVVPLADTGRAYPGIGERVHTQYPKHSESVAFTATIRNSCTQFSCKNRAQLPKYGDLINSPHAQKARSSITACTRWSPWQTPDAHNTVPPRHLRAGSGETPASPRRRLWRTLSRGRAPCRRWSSRRR